MAKLSKESQMSINEMLDEYVVQKIKFEEDREKIIKEIQFINDEIQKAVKEKTQALRVIGEENKLKSEEILYNIEQLNTLKKEIESIKKTQCKLSKITFFLIILSSLSIVGIIISIILLII